MKDVDNDMHQTLLQTSRVWGRRFRNVDNQMDSKSSASTLISVVKSRHTTCSHPLRTAPTNELIKIKVMEHDKTYKLRIQKASASQGTQRAMARKKHKAKGRLRQVQTLFFFLLWPWRCNCTRQPLAYGWLLSTFPALRQVQTVVDK